MNSVLLSIRSVIISQTRNAATVKRRKSHPSSWLPKKRADSFKPFLTRENQLFIDEYVKDKYESPLAKEAQKIITTWSPDSKRCGLIARKIGVHPMWMRDGKRILCTLLQVNDNHVIRCYSAEEYRSKVIPQDRWRWDGYGCAIVGAESDHPMKCAASYLGLFNEAGVPPKKKLTKMLITDDAMLSPGTPLYVSHFRVGDYVDCWGITIDRGFQGVVKRWDFAGGPAGRNTKFMRRPGSIGHGRRLCGPFKGHPMAGHMGRERRTHVGTQIMRINTKHNIIYVRGPAIPGENGNWVYIYDTQMGDKKAINPDNPPPFPTYFPKPDDELPEDLYHPSVHPHDEPTITFKPLERKPAARTGAKLAKVKGKK